MINPIEFIRLYLRGFYHLVEEVSLTAVGVYVAIFGILWVLTFVNTVENSMWYWIWSAFIIVHHSIVLAGVASYVYCVRNPNSNFAKYLLRG